MRQSSPAAGGRRGPPETQRSVLSRIFIAAGPCRGLPVLHGAPRAPRPALLGRLRGAGGAASGCGEAARGRGQLLSQPALQGSSAVGSCLETFRAVRGPPGAGGGRVPAPAVSAPGRGAGGAAEMKPPGARLGILETSASCVRETRGARGAAPRSLF